MKKVIALALALVLALSLGVSALADLVPVKLLGLTEPDSTDDGYTLIKNDFDFFGYKGETDPEKIYVGNPEGGVFYVAIVLKKDAGEYKNITFEKSGVVSAIEQVAYDPAKFTTESHKDENGNYDSWAKVGTGTSEENYSIRLASDLTKSPTQAEIDAAKAGANNANDTYTFNGTSSYWNICKKDVDYLNKYATKDEHAGANKYVVYCDSTVYLFKITVDANYDVAYKDGYYKINADLFAPSARKGTAVTSKKVTVVSDVAVFDYDRVTWCGQKDETLYIGDDGYSDYRSYLNTYMPEYKDTLTDADVYLGDYSTVVSTTAFRAILGKGLTVGYDTITKNVAGTKLYDGKISVVIPEIAAAQKGVNFWMDYTRTTSDDDGKWGKLTELSIDFKGKDVIASAATVEVDLPYSYLELLNDFGKKVEEEDIVTYYILKDGKLKGQFTADYLTEDWDAQVKFDIPVEAGEALGEYTLVLEVPAAGAEENPNTGAESVIGVVAAMAAVSVVAAAAVSLKK